MPTLLDRVTLRHVRAIRDLVQTDFGGQRKFFAKNMKVRGRVAKSIHCKSGHLFHSFKLRSMELNSRNNCFSDGSLAAIVRASKFSLEELVIRNGHKLSFRGLETIGSLTRLRKLDLSYCRQISDEVFVGLFESNQICATLESLSVRFLQRISI